MTKRPNVYILLGVVLIVGLLLTAPAVVTYLVHTFWTAPAGDRPTLVYFRADL